MVQLKALVKYQKRKGDKAIPVNRPELVVRYHETANRSEQLLEAYLRDGGFDMQVGEV